MSEEDQMMQAIALSLGENFSMVVDQVIFFIRVLPVGGGRGGRGGLYINRVIYSEIGSN